MLLYDNLTFGEFFCGYFFILYVTVGDNGSGVVMPGLSQQEEGVGGIGRPKDQLPPSQRGPSTDGKLPPSCDLV